MIAILLSAISVLCSSVSGIYVSAEHDKSFNGNIMTMTVCATGTLNPGAVSIAGLSSSISSGVSAHIFGSSGSCGSPISMGADRSKASSPVLTIDNKCGVRQKPVCMASASVCLKAYDDNGNDFKWAPYASSMSDVFLAMLSAMRPTCPINAHVNIQGMPMSTIELMPWTSNMCMPTGGAESYVIKTTGICMLKTESFLELGFDFYNKKNYVIICSSASSSASGPMIKCTNAYTEYTGGIRFTTSTSGPPPVLRRSSVGGASVAGASSDAAGDATAAAATKKNLARSGPAGPTASMASCGTGTHQKAAVLLESFKNLVDSLDGLNGLSFEACTSSDDMTFDSPLITVTPGTSGNIVVSINSLHVNFFSANFNMACMSSIASALIKSPLADTLSYESITSRIIDNFKPAAAAVPSVPVRATAAAATAATAATAAAGAAAPEPAEKKKKRKRRHAAAEHQPTAEHQPAAEHQPIVTEQPAAPEPEAELQPEPSFTASAKCDIAALISAASMSAAAASAAVPADPSGYAGYSGADAGYEPTDKLLKVSNDDEAFGTFGTFEACAEAYGGSGSAAAYGADIYASGYVDQFGQYEADGQGDGQGDGDQGLPSLTSMLLDGSGSGGFDGGCGLESIERPKKRAKSSRSEGSNLSLAWGHELRIQWPALIVLDQSTKAILMKKLRSSMNRGSFAQPGKAGAGSGGSHDLLEKVAALNAEIVRAAEFGCSEAEMLELIRSTKKTNNNFHH